MPRQAVCQAISVELPALSFAVLATVALSVRCDAAMLKGAWEFNNSLNSSIAGAPVLLPINPLGTNTFEQTLVFGESRMVYRTNATGGSQAGLSVMTLGLINPASFSVEMVIASIDNQSGNGWRSILNTNNFAFGIHSDNALYFDDLNRLTAR